MRKNLCRLQAAHCRHRREPRSSTSLIQNSRLISPEFPYALAARTARLWPEFTAGAPAAGITAAGATAAGDIARIVDIYRRQAEVDVHDEGRARGRP
jgi:hypothetical protein